MNLFLSIVAPIYNEEENIPVLYEEIKRVLSGKYNFEVILVNDGSTGNSENVINELCKKDERVKAVHFRKNFGQSSAMDAGFNYATGDVIVSMDADLQNDPADTLLLIEEINNGYDLAVGWRKNRKDNILTRNIPSWVANRLISLLTRVKLHDYGCSFKAYRKDLLEHIRLYGEAHRFIPVLAHIAGAKIKEIPVNHRPRTMGVSKYGLSRVYNVIMDLQSIMFFMKYFSKPLRIIGLPGIIFTLGGSASILYLVFIKLFLGASIAARPLLVLGTLLVVIGVLFLGMGILAEFMVKIYYECSGKKPYIVKKTLNIRR